MEHFKPLLSGKVTDTATLPYPMLASPKLDGIRAVNLGGGLVSRNLKAIPNKHCQKLFGGVGLEFFDGELICGEPTDKDCYRNTNSAVMSVDGEPDVKLYVFDHFEYPERTFGDRLTELEGTPRWDNIVVVPHEFVHSEVDLLNLEEKWLAEGYEGVMLRRIDGRYKFGRSTNTEAILLKLKRFDDAEAQIIGFEELMSNQNEATKDELGHTERSSHASGMVPMGVLGALIVKRPDGVEFKIGTGLTAADRSHIWSHRESLLHSFVKYKSFAIGVKDKPRFPVLLGFRAGEDR